MNGNRRMNLNFIFHIFNCDTQLNNQQNQSLKYSKSFFFLFKSESRIHTGPLNRRRNAGQQAQKPSSGPRLRVSIISVHLRTPRITPLPVFLLHWAMAPLLPSAVTHKLESAEKAILLFILNLVDQVFPTSFHLFPPMTQLSLGFCPGKTDSIYSSCPLIPVELASLGIAAV